MQEEEEEEEKVGKVATEEEWEEKIDAAEDATGNEKEENKKQAMTIAMMTMLIVCECFLTYTYMQLPPGTRLQHACLLQQQ